MSCGEVPSDAVRLWVDDGQASGYPFGNIPARQRRGYTSTAFPIRMGSSIEPAMEARKAHATGERFHPIALVEARPMPIKRWCVCEQIFLPQSVLEDLNPMTPVFSEQSELQPPWHAARILIDWARKAERAGILVAVPFHQPIELSLF